MALITAAEVINRAFTNANTDTSLIKSTFIEISELNHIRPVLGEDLYNEILTQSLGTLTALNSVLLESYIKDYLAFCVKFEVLPDISYNTTSQGVVENLADFTNPVSEKKLAFLRTETYRKADTFKKKMVEYLVDNHSDYPLWVNETSGGVIKKFGIITY